MTAWSWGPYAMMLPPRAITNDFVLLIRRCLFGKGCSWYYRAGFVKYPFRSAVVRIFVGGMSCNGTRSADAVHSNIDFGFSPRASSDVVVI